MAKHQRANRRDKVRAMNLKEPKMLQSHITHISGKCKTVCVTACLTAIGVPIDGFDVTGTIESRNYLRILNRHGYSTRSRLSKMPKSHTIGRCRAAIKKLNESAVYFVIVRTATMCHALLLDSQGLTVVDTDKRKRDKRLVYSIHAITKLGSNDDY